MTNSESGAPLNTVVRPRLILLVLATVITSLGVAHSIVWTCWLQLACGPLYEAIINYGYLFDLSAEKNVPTWFSATQLAGAAMLLAVVATFGGADRGRWWGLVALFVYLSLDEATDMHGLWIGVLPGKQFFEAHRGFDWIIPGVFVVAAVAFLYLPWVLKLPRDTRALFILAGAVYVGGGLGLEGVGALVVDESFKNPSYLAVSMAEELLEMLGVSIMIFALFRYMGSWRVDVRPDAIGGA